MLHDGGGLSLAVILTLLGVPLAWLIMRKALAPADPEPTEANVQIGRFRNVKVSKRGMYYLKVVLFVVVILATPIKAIA